SLAFHSRSPSTTLAARLARLGHTDTPIRQGIGTLSVKSHAGAGRARAALVDQGLGVAVDVGNIDRVSLWEEGEGAGAGCPVGVVVAADGAGGGDQGKGRVAVGAGCFVAVAAGDGRTGESGRGQGGQGKQVFGVHGCKNCIRCMLESR
ncbi:hypothetical protein BO86DRAFT_427191, partial [Aspergillus japonicus CBS 114.51]